MAEHCHKCGGVILGAVHFIMPSFWLPPEEWKQMIDDNAPLPYLCGSCVKTIYREMKPRDRVRLGLPPFDLKELRP